MRLFIVALLLSCSPTAFSSPFSMTEYECAHMDVKRDGIKCMVSTEDGEYKLLIKYHLTQDASKELRDRANYMTNVVKNSFKSSGGEYIDLRMKDKNGSEIEKHCYRTPRYDGSYCENWQPVKD